LEEFRKIREEIDSIIDASKVLILKETVSDSMPGIENANKLVLRLEKMAKGEIQTRIVANRVSALQSLARSINAIQVKQARKKIRPEKPAPRQ